MANNKHNAHINPLFKHLLKLNQPGYEDRIRTTKHTEDGDRGDRDSVWFWVPSDFKHFAVNKWYIRSIESSKLLIVYKLMLSHSILTCTCITLARQ